jgi:DNA modification methylase
MTFKNIKRNTKLKGKGTIVYIGNVNKCLTKLPDESIDCVITSPPYWKQRDYKHPKQIGQENTYTEYIKKLTEVFREMKRVVKSTGTFFLNVGYKWENKELLLIPELLATELQKNGWALLNKIIWNKPNAMPSSLDNRFSNVYEPVFLFVKKENKYKYYLSLDELRKPISNFTISKKPEDIIGLKVKNALFKDSKGKDEGKVEEVFKTVDRNILAQVKWTHGERSLILVNDFAKESQIKVDLICSSCGKKISNEIDLSQHINCNGFPKPILPPKSDFDKKIELKKIRAQIPLFVSPSIYKGKYKLSPENRGSSPGARKSLFGEYLVLQRRYKIIQPLIADYLRFWRKKKGITIKEIDKLLGYRDTAGHWFRKDTGSWGKGGAVPSPDDWVKLKEILGFDNTYDRWLTEYHLVLQTVKPHPRGRNPGDVWDINTQPLPEAHFATFPEELVKRCILAGCPPNGVVLDPFAGSGTTGKVAEDLKRSAILIELIPQYLEIIKKRCKNIKKVIYVN